MLTVNQEVEVTAGRLLGGRVAPPYNHRTAAPLGARRRRTPSRQCYPHILFVVLPLMATKPTTDEAVVQLATRIPRALLQRIRIFCVQNERTMQAFVSEALREKLVRTKLVPLVMSAAELLAA